MIFELAANAVPVEAVAPPPVTVEVKLAPVVPLTFPRKAFDRRSPAATWKALVEDVNAIRCLPEVLSVDTDAWMPAFLKAVAAALEPFPAEVIAAFTAFTNVEVSETPLRFTDTFTRLESPKPDPRKKTSV